MKSFYTLRIFIIVVFFAGFLKPVIAQNFHLVKDLNTSTDSNPANFNSRLFNHNSKRYVYAVLNGVSYFAADDGINGKGFWRSDGTEGGTYQLKEGVNPENITASGGTVYFAGSGNLGLWKSDGTKEGTVPVLNTPPPGLANFNPTGLTDFNGTLFFLIRSNTSEDQLWKTDGTASGTIIVKDFRNPDPAKSFAELVNLIVIKNKLYFSASTFAPYASRLWVSDGTAAGTHIISNDLMEPAQTIAASSSNNDSLVYFTASTEYNGSRALYVTNGDSGNAKIANGFTGFVSSNYYGPDICRIGSGIYYTGRPDAATRAESLYKYDLEAGFVQPVMLLTGTNPPGTVSTVSNLTNVDSSLYFTVFDATINKSQLWKSDGNSAGNMLLKDNFTAGQFTKANGVVFFSGNDNVNGAELWRTDGTASGTSMVKDINSGISSSAPAYFTAVNGKVFFSAKDSLHGSELWASDGTSSGTSIIKDINQTSTSGSYPTGFTPSNNTLIFAVNSPTTNFGRILWKSDGTNAGTSVISDTLGANLVPYPDTYAVHKNQIYFFGRSLSAKQGMYKADISTGRTTLLKDFTAITASSNKTIATDSLVYFLLQDYSSSRYELWRTDGSEANTFVIKSDFSFFNFNLFKSTGNTLFFSPPNSNSLWKTNGTVDGTIELKAFAGNPFNLVVHAGSLFFEANDGVSSALWKSDGTVAGTIKVTDNVSGINNFISSNGELFFTANGNSDVYGNVGQELFKTDGTQGGTVLVKDIHPGTGSTAIYKSIRLNGTVYFFTNPTSNYPIELWKSDGTATGTKYITTVDFAPTEVVTCNGKLLFICGSSLWESDGTLQGTHKVEDTIFSTLSLYSYNNDLTAVGNQLFFTATNYKYGQELYAGYISKPGVVNYFSAANGNWNDPATWVGNVVPPTGAGVVIKHNVTGNVKATCSELRVEETGTLTMNEGVNITMLQ